MRSLLALSILTAAVSGCSTHQCDASSADAGAGQVAEFDGTWTWQSSSIDSGWIPFNGEETITFTLPNDFPPLGTPGLLLVPYVSTAPDQDAGLFVLAGGQDAEMQILGPRTFTVLNATCAPYYLRVVATVTVPSAPVDAGADAPHD